MKCIGARRRLERCTRRNEALASNVETVKQLVGAEQAQRLHLLKADLEGEPFDLDAPDDTDIYDGDAVTANDR